MPKAVLCTTLSLSFFIKRIFKKCAKYDRYYFDLYVKTYGIVLWVLVKKIGHKKISHIITKCMSVIGFNVCAIPHSEAVPEYHWLNINAHKQCVELAEWWLKNHAQTAIYGYYPLLDLECQRSIQYKIIADRLWLICENLAVLRQLGYTQLDWCLYENYLPKPVVAQLAEKYNINVCYQPKLFYYLQLPFLALWMLAKLMLVSVSCVFSAMRRCHVINTKRNLVAVELVMPNGLGHQVSHANFMQKLNGDDSDFMYYVRSERRRHFKTFRTETHKTNIIYLQDLKPPISSIKYLASIYLSLLQEFNQTHMPIYYLWQRFRWANFYLELLAFLHYFPVKVHVYNTFANAPGVTVRLDAGIVTGLCRHFGVASISYQTRVMYYDSYYHYYDAFDVCAMWGKAWRDLIIDKSFIKNYPLIGNVDLLPVSVKPNSPGNKIVVFNSDIDPQYPQHYTPSYNAEFFKIILSALVNKPSHYREIWIKPKNREDITAMLYQDNIKALQTESGIAIRLLDEGLYDIWGAITAADIVISIGFTTPGLCALMTGKKSIYVTPYKADYNKVFVSTAPFIVHDTNELSSWLQANNEMDRAQLEQLDPYRDGQAAMRLYAICQRMVSGELCK